MGEIANVGGCSLLVSMERLYCKYYPEESTIYYPEVVDTKICDSHYSKEYAKFGCDYATATGQIDIEQYKKYVQGYLPEAFDFFEEVGFDWEYIYSEATYDGVAEYFEALYKSFDSQ